MSAEELKDAVRTYADEHHPGWRAAGVAVRVGEIGDDDEQGEYLLVRPTPAGATAPPQPIPATG